MSDVDEDWEAKPRRPAWIRVVAGIAALALVLPLVVAAVDQLL